MARNWEQQLRSWAKPASQTEENKRTRTERAITDALNAMPGIADRGIHVYAKGSYANRTNVRLDSDVDVNVECVDVEYFEFDDDQARASHQSSPVTNPYEPHELRSDVV